MNREIDLIVIHCAYTSPKMDIGVKEIDEWHRARGWNQIGYHYVVRRDGTVEHGRSVKTVGAHVKGFNAKSIGVCLVGGTMEGRDEDDCNFTRRNGALLIPSSAILSEPIPMPRSAGIAIWTR
jgi:N-acetylmuramoyl-L-alanine amidase